MTDSPPSGTPASATGRQSFAIGELLFALALTAVGAMTVALARSINVPVSGADIGPRVFPYIVGTLLTVIGTCLCVQVLRGKAGEEEIEEDVDESAPTDWRTVGLLIGAIVVHTFLIIPAGWPAAAFVLFSAVAWVLGARPWWHALLIGAGLALLLQFAFGGLLGLSLPAGPILEQIEIFHG